VRVRWYHDRWKSWYTSFGSKCTSPHHCSRILKQQPEFISPLTL